MSDTTDDEDARATLPKPERRSPATIDTIPMRGTSISAPARVRLDVSFPPARPSGADERYEGGALLGEGGMGEVRICRDRRIGREVALKTIREEIATRRDYVVRFEREARVQGQLEHPSIVPVYDLGVDAAGRTYFTMKRVRGRTLAEVIDALRQGDPDIAAAFSTRRLLNAFTQVCLAIDFAHSRGVLHRDIKPENVMLGDYGEVSVLDWGIATVVEDLRATGEHDKKELVDAEIDEAHKTMAGEMVGSPGYMSPEQINGNLDEIDERADIFALGSVLYEILTLEPLVDGKSVPEIMTKTLAGVDARARERAPLRDVPPELEMVCIRATAPLADRFASARELSRAVERYLDGDRDLERRKELAAACLCRAEHIAPRGRLLEDADRTRALRELSTAVALDPSNARARELLGAMLLSSPDVMPEQAKEALEAQRTARRVALRKTLFLVSLIFLTAPFALLMLGPRDWRYFTMITIVNAAVPITGFLAWRGGASPLMPSILMVTTMVALSFSSFVMGPLINAPTIILAVAILWTALSVRKVRLLAMPVGLLGILVPLGLQLTGVLEPSYSFERGTLEVLPVATDLPASGTLFYLTSIAVAAVVFGVLIVYRQQAVLERIEERLFLHLHSLEKLLPEGAGGRYSPEEVGQ